MPGLAAWATGCLTCSLIQLSCPAGLQSLVMTNCSQIALLPSLTPLGSLSLLDMENCTGLTTLPALPASLDVLLLSGCEKLCLVQPCQVSCVDAARIDGEQPCSHSMTADCTMQDAKGFVSGSQTPASYGLEASASGSRGGADEVLGAMPQSLTEVQALHCPLFSSPESHALLAAFLLSNRLMQWDRFKEADVLLRYATVSP